MPITHRRQFLATCSALAAVSVLPETLSADENGENAVNSNVQNSETCTEVGNPYAGWKEGEMDLHFILNGASESMFHIYPDGTTLLLDAGDRATENYAKNIPLYPDGSRLASEWIMRYLSRVNPSGRNIDYMMLSHYHSDHGGNEEKHAGKTQGRGDDYYLSGLANIGEHFTFKTVFDRGYPTYDKPIVLKSDGYTNFVKFTKYMLSAGKFKMEEFEVGKLDQIRLLNDAETYPTFHIRNICRNGVVWTGEEGKNRDFYAEPASRKGWVNENTLSIGMTIEYGSFRYFTGGDLSGRIVNEKGEDLGIEGYTGTVVGPLDVCKTNHHSYKDSMTLEFTQAVQAKVYVSNVWDLYHLQDNTMTNMTQVAEDVLVCPTAVHEGNREIYPDAPWLKNLAPEAWEGGHVVVKVYDGGARYKVYYLSAQDEKMTVKKVYGPFVSRVK